MSSLGDVIHVLPAISDAAKRGVVFDWVIDGAFREVAGWHPSVGQVFVTHHRRWRRELLQKEMYCEVGALLREVRKNEYDLVLDGQGNFKTALLALLTKGVRAGYDSASVREWVAHWVYQKKYSVSWEQHAVARLRKLFAYALDYPLPKDEPDFGIEGARLLAPSTDLPRSYFVFIHSASRESKLWGEENWRKLAGLITGAGHEVLLPWGSAKEKERAGRLATPGVRVLPRLSLSELGFVVKQARGVVGLDTGLSHLAGALKTPCVTLYGPTDPRWFAVGGKVLSLNSSPEEVFGSLAKEADI